jgi:hypothetical protein
MNECVQGCRRHRAEAEVEYKQAQENRQKVNNKHARDESLLTTISGPPF